MVAGVLGILAIFLPWMVSSAGIIRLGFSLVAILRISQAIVLTIGAAIIVLGSVALFVHPIGVFGQIAGIVLIIVHLLSLGDLSLLSGATGFILGLVSVMVAGVGLMYRWTRTEEIPAV